MRTLAQQLGELITIADRVMRQPLTAFSDRDHEIAAELRHSHALPADGVRCTNAAMAMLAALDGLRQSGSSSAEAAPWQMLVGAILPLLRAEAYRQFVAEKEMARG
jgi:hypothetical protein